LILIHNRSELKSIYIEKEQKRGETLNNFCVDWGDMLAQKIVIPKLSSSKLHLNTFEDEQS